MLFIKRSEKEKKDGNRNTFYYDYYSFREEIPNEGQSL
jgi:hypothetical protein